MDSTKPTTPADLLKRGIDTQNTKLIDRVLVNVFGRMIGEIKSPMNEPLDQIIANAQAVIDLESEML